MKRSTEPQILTLSEYESKRVLVGYGGVISQEVLVQDPSEAGRAAKDIGLPVVVKLCGARIAHKTERNLVRLGLDTVRAVERAAHELWARRRDDDGEVGLLVAEMVAGRRELIAGMVRDPQFGPCVLLGLGGVLTEALGDVVFALAPLSLTQARAMVEGLRFKHLVTQPFRGEGPVDLDALADLLVGLGRLAVERPDIESVDVNPLIVVNGKPIAVDALVVTNTTLHTRPPVQRHAPEDILERFAPCFTHAAWSLPGRPHIRGNSGLSLCTTSDASAIRAKSFRSIVTARKSSVNQAIGP